MRFAMPQTAVTGNAEALRLGFTDINMCVSFHCRFIGAEPHSGIRAQGHAGRRPNKALETAGKPRHAKQSCDLKSMHEKMQQQARKRV